MNADAERSERVRIELAVRTLSPEGTGGRQARIVERLGELEAAGAIDEFSVQVWGKRVGLDTVDAETDHAREVVETVDSFREWADRNDLSVGTFFETRRVDNRITDDSYTALELPSMAMAEYRDGDLEWVSPCLDPETGATYPVHDRVETVEETLADPVADATSGPATVHVPEE